MYEREKSRILRKTHLRSRLTLRLSLAEWFSLSTIIVEQVLVVCAARFRVRGSGVLTREYYTRLALL